VDRHREVQGEVDRHTVVCKGKWTDMQWCKGKWIDIEWSVRESGQT